MVAGYYRVIVRIVRKCFGVSPASPIIARTDTAPMSADAARREGVLALLLNMFLSTKSAEQQQQHCGSLAVDPFEYSDKLMRVSDLIVEVCVAYSERLPEALTGSTDLERAVTPSLLCFS